VIQFVFPVTVDGGKKQNLFFSPEQARLIYQELHKIFGEPVIQNIPQSMVPISPPPEWPDIVSKGSMLN